MEGYFVMHRVGTYKTQPTPNGCRSVVQKDFNYEFKMLFPGDMILNKDSQILDHSHIDAMVRKLKPKGSCEQMHLTIMKALPLFMERKKITLAAYKATIRPVIKPGEHVPPAFMEYVWANSGFEDCLKML